MAENKMTENKTKLYLISPPHFDLNEFTETLKQTLSAAEVPVFQLRMKNQHENGQYIAPPDEDKLYQAIDRLMPICRDNNTVFILNDFPDIAKEVGADGVHVGVEDMNVKKAKQIVGENIIVGCSCYDSKDRAFTAGEQGADYVAFGAFYDTQTKTPRGRPSIDLLEFWQDYTTIPSVAIGGIKVNNVLPIVKARADFVAVVTGVWDYPEGAEQAVKDFDKIFEQNPF